MSAAALVGQLREWKGTGRIWQLRTALECGGETFERLVFAAVVLGWIVIDIDPIDDPDEDVLVITDRALEQVR
jgi:hypothetical protein